MNTHSIRFDTQGALFLANESAVDTARVGIWGVSYGGLNVLQAVARDSALFAAGASVAGIFNWVPFARPPAPARAQTRTAAQYQAV